MIVTNLDTSDLNHEHRGTKHVSSLICTKMHAIHSHFLHNASKTSCTDTYAYLVKVNALYLVHGVLNVLLVIQHVLRCDITEAGQTLREEYSPHT